MVGLVTAVRMLSSLLACLAGRSPLILLRPPAVRVRTALLTRLAGALRIIGKVAGPAPIAATRLLFICHDVLHFF